MEIVLLCARLVLATVLGVAGAAKLVDLRNGRRALAEFGLPSALAVPLAVLLPLAELMIAAALMPASTAWWGAVGAFGLLLAFIAGIGLNLVRGRRPACRCFGQIGSGPISWWTLARNSALAALAGLVVVQGPEAVGPSVVGWVSVLTPTEHLSLSIGALLITLLAAEAWVLVKLWGLIGRLLLRIEALETSFSSGVAPLDPALTRPTAPEQGLPVGSPAPAFSLAGVYGETLTLDALRAAGRPVLLAFTDPGCGPCNALMPEFGQWQREHGAMFTIAIISRGGQDVNRAKAAEHGLATMLLQQDYEIANAYQAYGTPSSVLVRPDGMIGSTVASGGDAIRALVGRVVGGENPIPLQAVPPNGRNGHDHALHAHPAVPQIGDSAPALKLPDIDGKMLDLAQLRGKPTLVLFWNPSCGYCQQMLPDLKAWEAARSKDAPRLLVVSTGGAAPNRAMGLKSSVLLEPDFAAGSAFGVNGTPSAVLVDAKGRIASPIAVGGPAVLRLARSGRADEPRPA